MQKQIYKYELDGETIYGDPFEMDLLFHDTLREQNVDVEQKLEQLDNPKLEHTNWIRTFKAISPGVYAMFGAKPLDRKTGEGHSLEDMLTLYSDFNMWRAGVKKNTDETQSLELPTESTQPESIQTEPHGSGNTESTGSSNTDSGSIDESQVLQSDPPSATG